VGAPGAPVWEAPRGTGLGFERPVPPGGYLWWYVDAISDDGTEALTLIAFVGSVFSPYYAWAGRKDPEDHVAVNVALYRKGLGRWAMTERGRADLSRSADSLRVGPSGLRSVGDALEIDVSEQGWPIPRKLVGRVRVLPEVRGQGELVLSAAGDHRWWPIAPRARVEVSFDEPGVKWSGTGYLDSNWGAEPLEAGFANWTWSRAPLSRGAAVLYDVVPRRSEARTMAMRFDASGVAHEIQPPPAVKLPTTLFGIGRQTRSEGSASLVRTLTDAHFYARSVVRSKLCGEDVLGVHESLSLDRFGTRWAKLLLPFRMPRKVR
jgi:carotenoid 1,2-hydratase